MVHSLQFYEFLIFEQAFTLCWEPSSSREITRLTEMKLMELKFSSFVLFEIEGNDIKSIHFHYLV